jgi:hypothetical protein
MDKTSQHPGRIDSGQKTKEQQKTLKTSRGSFSSPVWRSIGVPSLWNPTLSYSTESLRSEAVALRRERTSPGGEREREREGASVQSSQLQSTIDSQTVKTLTCEPLL